VRRTLLLRRAAREAGIGVNLDRNAHGGSHRVNPLRDETVWDRLALVAMSGTIWFIALVALTAIITKGI
jgi:hypothetical protein